MYLSRLKIENFRIFGSGDRSLDLSFSPGLTVLVGPNDGGKTAIIDAIRLVLGTTSRDGARISEDDFHHDGVSRQPTFRIECKFEFGDPSEAALFFEHITPEANGPVLYLVLNGLRQPDQPKRSVIGDLRSGSDGLGPRPDGTMRSLMAATYLRALRDALDELSAGRGSRLSQILLAHPKYRDEGVTDFDAAKISADGKVEVPKTLVGIMRMAEHGIESNSAVEWTRDQLNSRFLDRLSLAGFPVEGTVGITRAADLRDILEKLDLWIASAAGRDVRINRGLGTNNILYMASEMLLVGASGDDGLPLLLIEEPEAHLHPQLQLLVGDFLREQSDAARPATKPHGAQDEPLNDECRSSEPAITSAPLQVIVSTHSPILASQVDLDHIVVVVHGRAFPIARGCTRLDADDYRFLARFLDATRANLFFAAGVLIVEGDGEALLLPTLAVLLGRPLNRHGVAIVKVGSVGLFRYSRIFQAPDASERLPIRVACVADLDLKAGASEKKRAAREAARRRNDGGSVHTFVSPHVTLEYDIAYCGLAREMYKAVTLATNIKKLGRPVSDSHRAEVLTRADSAFDELERNAKGDMHALATEVYEPLRTRRASKAETAQQLSEILLERCSNDEFDPDSLRRSLPEYLVNAIEYVTGEAAPAYVVTEPEVADDPDETAHSDV